MWFVPRFVEEFVESALRRVVDFVVSGRVQIAFYIARSLRRLAFFAIFGGVFVSIVFATALAFLLRLDAEMAHVERRALLIEQKIHTLFGRAEGAGELVRKAVTASPDFSDAAGPGGSGSLENALSAFNLSMVCVLEYSGAYQTIFGALDSSEESREWEVKRMGSIRGRIDESYHNARGAPQTIYVGVERRYRNRDRYPDATAEMPDGSIVLARVWGSDTNWRAVILGIPLVRFAKISRSEYGEYLTGSYDYLMDLDSGNAIMHAKRYHILGSDHNGVDVRGASKRDEIGYQPFNIEAYDWITGKRKFKKAYDDLVRGESAALLYQNINRIHRFTGLHKCKLEDTKMYGNGIGIISGMGLNRVEYWLAQVFLGDDRSKSRLMWSLGTMFVLISLIWFITIGRLNVLHSDIRAIRRYADVEHARRRGLLPMPKRTMGEVLLRDMIAVLVGIDALQSEEGALREIQWTLSELSACMREEGWVTISWDRTSMVLAREFEGGVESGGVVWAPTVVVESLRRKCNLEKGVLRGKRLRMVYAFGELQFSYRRRARERDIVIAVSGSCVSKAAQWAEELRRKGSPLEGSLVYWKEDVERLTLKLVGEEVSGMEGICYRIDA